MTLEALVPARDVERMMKLQDVILKAMAKKLSWLEAAEIAGMSVRNMQRKRQAYVEYGYTGLFDQRRGKRSIHRVPMETAERVLALYRDRYFDLTRLSRLNGFSDEFGSFARDNSIHSNRSLSKTAAV